MAEGQRPATRFRCDRGHTWGPPGFPTGEPSPLRVAYPPAYAGPQGERLCPFCVAEFLVKHCGKVEVMPDAANS